MENSAIIEALSKISCQKETKTLFGSIFMPYELKKREVFHLTKLDKKRPILFLSKGMLHLIQQSGTTSTTLHKTIRFYQPGQFFVHPVLTTTAPLTYQLSALIDSTLYQTTYQKIQALYQIDANIAEIILSIQDQWNQATIDEIAMLHQPALNRYQEFTEKIGIDHLHIPKKHLANYLLMSTKHLGRLNRQLLSKP